MPLRRIILAMLVVLLLGAGGAAALCPGAILRWLTVDDVAAPADAIVLLAGSMNERAPTAAMLYRNGLAPRVLLSNYGMFSSWWAEEELVQGGARQAIVKLPYLGTGTVYEVFCHRDETAQKEFTENHCGDVRLPYPPGSMEFS